ncbi:4'-phosphopantetheinyl transferase family protein [Roseateles sp. BYS78W]|uniref:4'-phosphopantetheinyl transferase family protein n=1 Tax=Pelomonas candidula TaxID=3299025 RepID=A0ABW7HIH9_9BURK
MTSKHSTWACAAPLEQTLAPVGTDAGWLSPAERERCERFSGAQRRRQFVGGRWLARLLLAHVRGVADPASLVLGLDPDGRSKAPPPWRLSISHSGDWIGVAVADASLVGMDLQVDAPGRDWQALAAFAGLQPCLDSAYFYRHWTLAEAWLKAHPDITSLTSLRGLRWQPDAAGPAWHGQVGALHWTVVGASAPQWVGSLLPQSLQPAPGDGWAPLDGTVSGA